MQRRYKQIAASFAFICMCIACAAAHAADWSFTVQVGTFSTLEAALNHRNFLKKNLPAQYRAQIRIEKSSGFYAVRVGRTLTYPVAAKTLKKVRPAVKDAFILKRPDARKGLPRDNESDVEGAKTASLKALRQAPAIPAAQPDATAGQRPDRQNEPASASASTSADTSRMTTAEDINLKAVDSTMSSFLEKKDYQKAVKYIEKAIAKSPRDPALYSWYGSSLIAANQPYQALHQFRKAAELAPRAPEFQNGIGYSYVYITLDAARQSIKAFRKVLLLDPNNVDALEGLGSIYSSIGEKQQAYEVYTRLAKRDKEAAKRLHTLMSNGLGLGEYD